MKLVKNHLYRFICKVAMAINVGMILGSLYGGYYQLIPLACVNIFLLSFALIFDVNIN